MSCDFPKNETSSEVNNLMQRIQSNTTKLNNECSKANGLLNINSDLENGNIGLVPTKVVNHKCVTPTSEEEPIAPSFLRDKDLGASNPHILHVSPKVGDESQNFQRNIKFFRSKASSVARSGKVNMLIKKDQIVQKKKEPLKFHNSTRTSPLLPHKSLGQESNPLIASRPFNATHNLESSQNASEFLKQNRQKMIDFIQQSKGQKKAQARLLLKGKQKQQKSYFKKIMKFSVNNEMMKIKRKHEDDSREEHKRRDLKVTFELPNI
ncbi:unnamed protein product [Moneuplotes crassus]|uniref:Uncharacterized protein n=1 Tax=Euplotes crassus TaxID=5936 RepID=A0AAD1X7U8_EUPCR|nr:unnamed protein product [Moneuplotes crassus]